MSDDLIMCEVCREAEEPTDVEALYALSLSESNSGANITFVCDKDFKHQVDFMLNLNVGSVDVQAMWL